MTDIKDLSKKLREARAKATPEISVGHPKMQHWPESIIGVDCCDEEPFVLTEMNRHMDRWKEDRDFFVLAANNMTRILDELDRLIEVEKVLKKQMTKGYPTGSEWIDIEKALKRADEIGKGK